MNLGLTTSFIIGGLLMIAIVSLNVRMGQNSADITMHSMNQSHISDISEIIKFDFPKIGYDSDAPIDNPIQVAEKHEIQFLSNLYNTGGSIQTVTWTLGDDALSGSDNSKLRTLTRTIDGDSQNINLGVSRFDLLYFMEGNSTPLSFPIDPSDREDINKIEVILEVESKEATGKNNSYTTSSWRKMFMPPNINIED